MCGLIGIVSRSPIADRSALVRWRDTMVRRGPDAAGEWWSDDGCVGFGHRRLSILDPQARANQPMVSDDGRFVIVFNGEIYNFHELRHSLERDGEVFRTTSDTEVLLKLFAREAEAMLHRIRGMFAFAIWDRQTRCVFLARDPYGIKPLYLARVKEGWLFASQVKSLLASGLVSRKPDPLGQAGFWLFGSVLEPRTWFREISAVPAGSWCRLSAVAGCEASHRYWDIGDSWRQSPECRLPTHEMQEIVRTAVADSSRLHLVSDVPVCVFLSGGIDSGALTGLIKDAGVAELHGVTLAFSEFEGKQEDEVPAAREIARHYGIHHHVRAVSRQEFEADLPRILAAMDQPSVDGINTWYASKAVAELGLKVVISGVGGDELFYGYPSFRQIPALVSNWNRLSRAPGARLAANLALGLLARYSGNPRWRWLTRQAGSLYGAYWLRRGLFTPDELSKLMDEDFGEEMRRTASPEYLLQSTVGALPADAMAAVGQAESMCYLRNQLLRDSDWASMDHSVELRTPLVDAWLLRDLTPVLRGFSRFRGKTMLGNSPTVPLPAHIISRTKTGFAIPVQRWLQDANAKLNIDGGSRGWARHLAAAYTEGWCDA